MRQRETRYFDSRGLKGSLGSLITFHKLLISSGPGSAAGSDAFAARPDAVETDGLRSEFPHSASYL
jgi:hypothetical protein